VAAPAHVEEPYAPPPSPYPFRQREWGWILLGLVVGGLLVAGVAAIALGQFGLTRTCPCPGAIVLDVSFEATGASHYGSQSVYSFQVTEVANGQPTYGDVNFGFTNGTGHWVVPTASWNLGISGKGANTTSFYEPAPGVWPGISGIQIVPGQTWVFTVPGLPLDGGTISLVGTNNPYTGTCSIGIP